MKPGEKGTGPADYYSQVGHAPGEVHPVDAAVDRLMPQRELRSKIRNGADRLVDLLGEHRGIWSDLESWLMEYRSEREVLYFSLGCEHGLAAGVSRESRRAARRKTDEAQRTLAGRIRDGVVQAGLPLVQAPAVLLETALSLAVGLGEPRGSDEPRERPPTS